MWGSKRIGRVYSGRIHGSGLSQCKWAAGSLLGTESTGPHRKNLLSCSLARLKILWGRLMTVSPVSRVIRLPIQVVKPKASYL